MATDTNDNTEDVGGEGKGKRDLHRRNLYGDEADTSHEPTLLDRKRARETQGQSKHLRASLIYEKDNEMGMLIHVM